MIVVPVRAQIDNNVAQEFFRRVFGDNDRAAQTVNAFLAISSFGNIVVWTFTAVRMKQEIAKQCFIPFAGFFAKDKDVSLGRLLSWFENGARSSTHRSMRLLNPANHREKTPVGALVLHLITCIVLLMATYSMTPSRAYLFLSKLLSYTLAACFGTLLAIGILILHFKGPPPTEPIETPNYPNRHGQEPVKKTWREMTRGTVNPTMGIACAVVYLIANLYLVVMTWVPPIKVKTPEISRTGSWYLVPVVSWCILAFSALWFLGFVAIIKWRSHSGRKSFVYMREPEFEWAHRSKETLDGDGVADAGYSTSTAHRGGLIMAHETIYRTWKAKETSGLDNRRPTTTTMASPDLTTAYEEPNQGQSFGVAGTDFDSSPHGNDRPSAGEPTNGVPRNWGY